jgi:hypothetical protein
MIRKLQAQRYSQPSQSDHLMTQLEERVKRHSKLKRNQLMLKRKTRILRTFKKVRNQPKLRIHHPELKMMKLSKRVPGRTYWMRMEQFSKMRTPTEKEVSRLAQLKRILMTWSKRGMTRMMRTRHSMQLRASTSLTRKSRSKDISRTSSSAHMSTNKSSL